MRKKFLLFACFCRYFVTCFVHIHKVCAGGFLPVDEVKIRTDQKNIRPSSLRMYVRQNPNAKWFSLIKNTVICL